MNAHFLSQTLGGEETCVAVNTTPFYMELSKATHYVHVLFPKFDLKSSSNLTSNPELPFFKKLFLKKIFYNRFLTQRLSKILLYKYSPLSLI